MARGRDRLEPRGVRVLFSQRGVAALIGWTQCRGTLAIEETIAAGGVDIGRELRAVNLAPNVVGH
jgi:hypothetical protein